MQRNVVNKVPSIILPRRGRPFFSIVRLAFRWRWFQKVIDEYHRSNEYIAKYYEHHIKNQPKYIRRAFKKHSKQNMIPPPPPPPPNGMAFRIAGYGFTTVLLIAIGPIVLWPLADRTLLPYIISTTLNGKENVETHHTTHLKKNINEREFEIKHLQYMLQTEPNDVITFFFFFFAFLFSLCVFLLF